MPTGTVTLNLKYGDWLLLIVGIYFSILSISTAAAKSNLFFAKSDCSSISPHMQFFLSFILSNYYLVLQCPTASSAAAQISAKAPSTASASYLTTESVLSGSTVFAGVSIVEVLSSIAATGTWS